MTSCIWGRDYNRIRAAWSTKWDTGVEHTSTSWACNGQSLISKCRCSTSSRYWSASWWVFIIGSVPDLSLKKETGLEELFHAGVILCTAPLPAAAATSWWQMLMNIHRSDWWAYINVTENCLMGSIDGWHAWTHRTCLTVNWIVLISFIIKKAHLSIIMKVITLWLTEIWTPRSYLK